MKKNFLYVSFFAAAFLVSCKSNEVEETPEVEVETEEVIEEPVMEEDTTKTVEAPAEEKKEEKTVSKKPSKTTTVVLEKEVTSDKTAVGSAMDAVKQAKQAKELTKVEGEAKMDKISSDLKKAKEEKDRLLKEGK